MYQYYRPAHYSIFSPYYSILNFFFDFPLFSLFSMTWVHTQHRVPGWMPAFCQKGDSVDINLTFSTQSWGTKTIEQRRLTDNRVRLDRFAAVGVAGHGCGCQDAIMINGMYPTTSKGRNTIFATSGSNGTESKPALSLQSLCLGLQFVLIMYTQWKVGKAWWDHVARRSGATQCMSQCQLIFVWWPRKPLCNCS